VEVVDVGGGGGGMGGGRGGRHQGRPQAGGATGFRRLQAPCRWPVGPRCGLNSHP
jgi:hypothetical protein